MLNYIHIREILQTIKRHKRRNILTGFGIAWGIFLLMVLLSFGEGLKNGIMKTFSGYTKNSLWIYGGEKVNTFSRTKQKERVEFSSGFLKKLRHKFPSVKQLSVEKTFPVPGIINVNSKSQPAQVKAVDEEYFVIKNMLCKQGRLFNHGDVKQQRNVCILGDKMAEDLFGESNPTGEYIQISGTWFLVIGTLKSEGVFGKSEQKTVFINYETSKVMYKPDWQSSSVFGLLLQDNCDATAIEKCIRNYIAHEYHFHEDEKEALYILNCNEQVQTFNKVFSSIRGFIWMVGICFLMSGIVGVGNMMLVIVKERTREIGIRKAVGAGPSEILRMILLESVFITTIAGLMGIVAGYLLITVINLLIQINDDTKGKLIEALVINIPSLIGAFIILIVSGCIAGFIPARRATEIATIQALNTEH